MKSRNVLCGEPARRWVGLEASFVVVKINVCNKHLSWVPEYRRHGEGDAPDVATCDWCIEPDRGLIVRRRR